MGTFRDDVVRAGRRIVESVEERTDRKVVPAQDLALLESDRSELRKARRMLDYIGVELLNYQPGMPGAPGGFELLPEARKFAYRESLTAWIKDPIAGQSVDLYVSFVFGRGVPRPQAHDPEVQEHLDNTWDDDANRRVLTSFEKLVEKGIDLCLQSNLFFTFFDDGEDGMCRVSLLRFDDVEDVVRHNELAAGDLGDRLRILYYKVVEQPVSYNFSTGQRETPADTAGNAAAPLKRIVYYEALDAFDDDDPVRAVQDQDLRTAPRALVRPGKVVHLSVNKTTEMAFGVPRFRRLVRWFTAYNEMIESHVNRMKAAASIYMKMTAKGGQADLERLGRMATDRPSAFGAAQEVDDMPVGPRGPGVIGQNESLNYEPFKIDSGAGDAQASAPILRGQAGGPWPDSYLSGNANGTVGGEQSLELPTLKFAEREQELWAGLLRKLGQASVAAAVRVGDITEWRDPTDAELDQIQAAEEAGEESPIELNEDGKVRRDLGFDLNFPSVLKRAMGDLVGAAVETATAVDPNGENPELSRWLFGFILAEAFDVENPQRIVDQVLPRKSATAEAALPIDPATGEPMAPAPAPAKAEGATGADGDRHTADNPYGVPIKAPQPEDRRVQESEGDTISRSLDDAFGTVTGAAADHLAALAALTPSTNGHHPE